MALYKRGPNKPKTIKIDEREFYKLKDAASRLGIEKTTMRKRLHEGEYAFTFGKLGTSLNAPLVVLVSDVESYPRGVLKGTIKDTLKPQFIQLSPRQR